MSVVLRLTGGVVVFCDPSTYPTQAEVLTLQQAGFHIAIGMHPKQTSLYTDADHTAIQKAVYPFLVSRSSDKLAYTTVSNHQDGQASMYSWIRY